MPKKTWTLNGFAGGLNTDSDLSDLVSSGGPNDEVAEIEGLFLDHGGKVVGALPIYTANDLSGPTQTAGDDNALVHDGTLYQKQGVYKIGDDVNYSGLADFQAVDMFTTNAGQHDTSPNAETVAPDISFWGERTTGSTSNWKEIILCLGKTSPYNPYGSGMICPLATASTDLLWPESKIRHQADVGSDGGQEDDGFIEVNCGTFTNLSPFDSGCDEAGTIAYYQSGVEGSYTTNGDMWDQWMCATDADESTIGTDAGGATTSMLALQGDADETIDVAAFDHFQQWHSNHNTGADIATENSMITFRVGGNEYDGTTDETGAFGATLPANYIGKDIMFDVKCTDTTNVEKILIVLDNQNTNARFISNGYETECKVYSLPLATLIEEGATNDYKRIRIPYDSAVYIGANFTPATVYAVSIFPVYTATYAANPAKNPWRVRELSFVDPISEDASSWENRYFLISSSRVNAKGIHSLPVNLADADAGTTTGTDDGKIVLVSTAIAKLKVSKPNIGSTAEGKLYYQEVTVDGAVLGDKFLLADWQQTNGVRSAVETGSGYTSWDTSTTPHSVTLSFNSPPTSSTFTLESGYPEGTEYVNALWKHAAVVGRTAYIGNVKQPTSAGSFDTSKILKSAIGKSAGFPNLQYIDVEFGGDGINHMEAIGDRLFVFGSNQMVVINVAQDIEFVEAQFPHLGVEHPRQVCKIGEGLAIVNQSGVWLFDGETLKDIKSEKNNGITIHATCAIAYSPILKYIIVWGWDNDDNDVAFFSTKTNSWVGRHDDVLAVPDCEVVAGPSGKVYTTHGSTTEVYLGALDNDSGTDQATILRTGKLSMGDIARNKKFYKVYINVTNAAGYTLSWSTTTASSWTTASSSLSDGTNEIALSGASGKYIMFRLVGASARTDFEMGELSIIYREKSVK